MAMASGYSGDLEDDNSHAFHETAAGSTLYLSGFLFGNIEACGQLEGDFQDEGPRKQLPSRRSAVLSGRGTSAQFSDSSLMPPPGITRRIPKKTSGAPLASLRPSKYADVDVRELYPNFQHGKVLRFSQIFIPNEPSKLWSRVTKPRNQNREPVQRSGNAEIKLNVGPVPSLDQCDTQYEDKFANPWGCDADEVNTKQSEDPLVPDTVSEDVQPDLELVEADSSPFDYVDDAFLMITQKRWEDDVIYDSSDIKEEVEQKLNEGLISGWKPGIRLIGQKMIPAGLSPLKAIVDTKDPDNRVENYDLIHSRWEDQVIWDAEALPPPKPFALDPNDDNLVLGIPEDVDPTKKAAVEQPSQIKGKNLRRSKLLPIKDVEDEPPVVKSSKDPYNISNDEFYESKSAEVAVHANSGINMHHSTPAVELRAPFFPTHLSSAELRTLHRKPLPRYTDGAHPVNPLAKHMEAVAERREAELKATGGGDMFFMRKPEDLSGKDGALVLLEYSEEHPPLLSQVGMCSRIKNFYKRKAKDSAPQYKYGETTLVHTSPFLGALRPSQSLQAVENNMYRAPIYEHRTPATDFLVIRDSSGYYIRQVDALFLVGQECPLYEVPSPNSKIACTFARNFLQAFIYRLFWNSADTPKRIRMDDIRKAFPSHSEGTIRKRLKLSAEFVRTGIGYNWWAIRPDFRLPPEEELRAMVTPEQYCGYLSMMTAAQRLKDAGYADKFLAPLEDDDEDSQLKRMEDEVQAAPWNTTRAYLQAMQGKCLLQLTGPADPTGCDEGFSYVRVSNKVVHGRDDVEPQPKKQVTGTDADLRRLRLSEAISIVRKNGIPEAEIKKLSRWDVIHLVRTLSTQKARAGEGGMKFSRGRFSLAEHQERYKEECQRLFDLQNDVLASDEVFLSDESDDDDDQDIEKMGKFIEDFLSHDKPATQLEFEREELERLEMQKTFLGDGTQEKPSVPVAREDYATKLAGKMLKIQRVFKTSEGKEFTRVELVRDPAVIEVYMRIRDSKDEAVIQHFVTPDDEEREELRKQKRRLLEQQRRLKRIQQKGTPGKSSRSKLRADLKMKCGACGQVGHMRTNKACPSFQSSTPSPSVALTEELEEMEQQMFSDDEELVTVDGVKVKLSSKVVKQAEEMKRKSLTVKVVNEVAKKRRRNASCDYLKPEKTINRRPRDPVVTLSTMLEEIVNELRESAELQPFKFPVTSREAPNYQLIVRRPMDLQTIREKLHQMKYQSREEFLVDINQMVENSALYNGDTDPLTLAAKRMLERCIQRLAEREEQFMRIEMAINPLLDDDAQVAFSYVLDNVVSGKLKSLAEASAFLRPVSKKSVKDYYTVVRNPMDLETIQQKIKAHNYRSRKEFLSDVELVLENSVTYNGEGSAVTQSARSLVRICKETLEEYSEHLAELEKAIRIAQGMEQDEDEFVEPEQLELSGTSETSSSQPSLEERSPERKKRRMDVAEDVEVDITEEPMEQTDDLQVSDSSDDEIDVESVSDPSGQSFDLDESGDIRF